MAAGLVFCWIGWRSGVVERWDVWKCLYARLDTEGLVEWKSLLRAILVGEEKYKWQRCGADVRRLA